MDNKKNLEKIKEYQKRYYIEHKKYITEEERRHRSAYQLEWRINHLELYKNRINKYRKRNRLKVLDIISNNNIHCVRCGCDDIRFLEINHKNGGGTEEIQGGKSAQKMFRDIYMGRRKTDDLELLCRICNAQHYLELRYGEVPYKIIYKKEEIKTVK